MALRKPSGGGRAPARIRRFVVAEDSMQPTLCPGDGLIGVRTARIRRGELRIFEHPDRAGFWLVKRVGHVRHDRFEALSDHDRPDVVDSRRFGDVPVEGSYRVLLRVRARRDRSSQSSMPSA